MSTVPYWNDSETDLWRKIARGFYDLAVADGFTGIEPNALDNIQSSMRKTCEYTYFLASI